MKRTKVLLTFVIVVLMMVTMIAGCAQNDTAEPTDEETTDDAAVVEEETTDDAVVEEETTEDTISVYFLLKTLSNPHWVAMKEGIEKAAADAGVDVFVDAMNSEDELSAQLDKLLTAAGQNYDGIGIAPISPTNAIEGVVSANENGIPVVNLDEKIDADELATAGGYLVGFATTDNVAVGATAANYIIETVGSEGEVAIIEGKAGNASGEARRDGAEAAFTEAGLTIVEMQPADWDRNKALDVATNIISQHPDIKAIYCANDTMALGAQEAVENEGLEEQIMVVGTDGIPDAFTSVAEGRMAATVAQDPAEIGVVCFNMLMDAINSGNAGSLDEEPAFKFVDSVLINE
jgi:D-allose transport system substrate-binding protein